MLDKQFTIISGSTCIVVLLMLLARTDAAPQVGEIDAMQETVTGAPSDSPIYSVYQVIYYGEIHTKAGTKERFINCKLDVTSDECRLEVGKSKRCPIKLAKDQGPYCQKLKQTIVNFNQVTPNRLAMEQLKINGVDTFGSTGTDITSVKKRDGRKVACALIKPDSPSGKYSNLHIYMRVLRE
eukprot:Nk52_evm1s59 gene=Nk52_evmTU1s59